MGFFFKQKTEYEMRISDGSSDVCSSDLTVKLAGPRCARRERHRDCRGDAVPGDCRHQCAREAGLAAAARCRNDEETALTHARCPSPIRFLRLQDERCRHQDRLAATITLRLVHPSSPSGSRQSLPLKKWQCRDLFSASPIRRSEEHTSELQSLMRISYAVFCLKTKNE